MSNEALMKNDRKLINLTLILVYILLLKIILLLDVILLAKMKASHTFSSSGGTIPQLLPDDNIPTSLNQMTEWRMEFSKWSTDQARNLPSKCKQIADAHISQMIKSQTQKANRVQLPTQQTGPHAFNIANQSGPHVSTNAQQTSPHPPASLLPDDSTKWKQSDLSRPDVISGWSLLAWPKMSLSLIITFSTWTQTEVFKTHKASNGTAALPWHSSMP